MPRHDLTFRQAFADDAAAYDSHVALLRRVFELDVAARDRLTGRDPAWMPFAWFDGTGRCVAAVEAGRLGMVLDGERASVTAIRLAAVDPDWRGHGLFRELMHVALAWCEAETGGATLLYTADHDLYRRFGFVPVAQHAFVGASPQHATRSPTRALTLEGDRTLIDRLLATRSPLSQRCAILAGPALFLGNVAGADDLELSYAAELDALIVHEDDEEELILVDVVAAAMPSLADILGALGTSARRVKTLFDPDRLGWRAEAVAEETGLMIRGPLPSAMHRPFMLPPTVEF